MSTSNDPYPNLMSVSEAAALTGLSTKWIAATVRAGMLPAQYKEPGLRGAYWLDRRDVLAHWPRTSRIRHRNKVIEDIIAQDEYFEWRERQLRESGD